MNTRNAGRLLAVLALAAVWLLPGEAQASDFLVRKHFAMDDSEPEVPNVAAPRARDQVVIAKSIVENRRIVESRRNVPAPADRSQNPLLRMLRILRALNLGGLAR